MLKSIAILGLFILMQVVSFSAAQVAENAGRLTSGPSEELSAPSGVTLGLFMLVGNVLLVVVLWLTRLVRHFPLTRGLSQSTAQWLLPVLDTLLLMFGLNFLLLPAGLDDNGQMALFESMKSSILCVLLLCVVGPLTEEFVFREGILRALASRGLPPVAAAVVSALLFAAVHANWAQAVPAFVGGVMLGLLYLHTGDIRLCGATHILNNSFAVLLLFYPSAEEKMAAMGVAAQLSVGIILCVIGGALLCYSIGFAINKKATLLFKK